MRSYLDEKLGWEDLFLEDAFEIIQRGPSTKAVADHFFVHFPKKLCEKTLLQSYNHVTFSCSEIQENATWLGAGGLVEPPENPAR